MDTFVFFLEIIGTVAFASSGAMTAIEKKMDIFGVNILGATTAVGGGMMRDIILGVTPPAAFSQPVYILFSILTSTPRLKAATMTKSCSGAIPPAWGSLQ